MPLYGVRESKPGAGAGIDWGQPLSQGLGGFYALAEAAGPTLYDATGRVPLSLTGSAAWTSGGYGPAILLNGNGKGAGGAILPALQGSSSGTLAIGYRPIGSPNATYFPVGIMQSSASGTPIMGIDANAANAGTWYNDGSNHFGSLATLVYGTDFIVTATFAPGAQLLYVNGVLKETATNATGLSWTAGAYLVIGSGNSSFASDNPNIQVYWAAWWQRALSAVEVAADAANPWQVFGAPRSYFLFEHAAAAQDPIGVASDTATLCIGVP